MRSARLAKALLVAVGCALACGFDSISHHQRPRGRHAKDAGALSAHKNKNEPPPLAFLNLNLNLGGIGQNVLNAAGLGGRSAAEDEQWGKQIVNVKNIQAENITVDALSETWKRLSSGESDVDALDHVWRDFIGDLNKLRQSKLVMAGVRAICVAVLTWGFCEGVIDSVSITGIRIWTALRQKSFAMRWDSFLNMAPGHRQVVLNTYILLRFRFGTLFFAANALGTLVMVPYYETLVCTIESVCFSREFRRRYPLVSKLQGLVLSVLVSWVFARAVAMAGIFACTVLGLGELWVKTRLGMS